MGCFIFHIPNMHTKAEFQKENACPNLINFFTVADGSSYSIQHKIHHSDMSSVSLLLDPFSISTVLIYFPYQIFNFVLRISFVFTLCLTLQIQLNCLLSLLLFLLFRCYARKYLSVCGWNVNTSFVVDNFSTFILWINSFNFNRKTTRNTRPLRSNIHYIVIFPSVIVTIPCDRNKILKLMKMKWWFRRKWLNKYIHCEQAQIKKSFIQLWQTTLFRTLSNSNIKFCPFTPFTIQTLCLSQIPDCVPSMNASNEFESVFCIIETNSHN